VPERNTIVIGGGVTGLASGLSSGFPVYEMAQAPGGICASYYMAPGSSERFNQSDRDSEVYRFEIGGGHWLWGGDPLVLHFMKSLTTFKSYARKAAVYLPDKGISVPYPIQNHLSYLGTSVAKQALSEMVDAKSNNHAVTTMADWLRACFGETLCDIFFDPFHDLYTAGQWHKLAPQDELKSPVNISTALEGAFDHLPAQSAGYNVKFLYPTDGLNILARRMAQRCNIHFERKVTNICLNERTVLFDDGTTVPYKMLLCTLPLDQTLRMADLKVSSKTDPYTSVMVINIGAVKGPRCPSEHWMYIPHSKSGFHRVGFYNNVDSSFLPASARGSGDRTGIYVEKAYIGGRRPSKEDTKAVTESVVHELQDWEWIGDVEVADPTWIETAYTWVWPNSQWRQEAMLTLQEHGIYQLGRYGRWAVKVTDQGIAQSIRDGLCAGASLKE
jgi:protoporphyrinogen oxidase